MERNQPGTEPDAQPHVQGASRGKGDHRDADKAGGGRRAQGSTEYGANGEPGGGPDEGYVESGEESGTAGNLDPHEPPGQG